MVNFLHNIKRIALFDHGFLLRSSIKEFDRGDNGQLRWKNLSIMLEAEGKMAKLSLTPVPKRDTDGANNTRSPSIPGSTCIIFLNVLFTFICMCFQSFNSKRCIVFLKFLYLALRSWLFSSIYLRKLQLNAHVARVPWLYKRLMFENDLKPNFLNLSYLVDRGVVINRLYMKDVLHHMIYDELRVNSMTFSFLV